MINGIGSQTKHQLIEPITSTAKLFNGTNPHAPITETNSSENNFHNILYRLQHVYKHLQDVNIGKLHFRMILVPNCTSVPLNENQSFGKNWTPHSSRRNSAKHKVVWTWTKNINTAQISRPRSVCTDLLKWTDELKITNSTKAFNG